MQIETAKARINQFPTLRWLSKAHEVRWTMLRDAVAIDAHENTPEPIARLLPIHVFPDGRVEITGMQIADYPDMQQRKTLCAMPPPEAKPAVVFLCNRFYHKAGHSFLYLHYPDAPEKDTLIDADGGKEALGHAGMLRSIGFHRDAVDSSTNTRMHGVSSFIGFPISAAQADLLQADAALTMLNPNFRYHLVNFTEDAVNCSGYAVTRLQNIGVPMEYLTNHRVARRFDNDHLPDYLITHPGVLHKDIAARGSDHPKRTTLTVDLPRRLHGTDDQPHQLHLTRTGDGVLLGEIRSGTARLARDKYLVYDFRPIVDHVMPALIDRDGQFRDLSNVEAIAPLALSPLNVVSQGLLGGGRNR